jgi:hypothetical protein
LSEAVTPQDPAAIIKAKNMYAACMDTGNQAKMCPSVCPARFQINIKPVALESHLYLSAYYFPQKSTHRQNFSTLTKIKLMRSRDILWLKFVVVWRSFVVPYKQKPNQIMLLR